MIASTPNDGSESIVLPNIATSAARIKIEAVDNIFFDISDADFTITETLLISIDDVTLAEGNAGTTDFTFTVSLSEPAGPGGVSFDIATLNHTATTADNDYAAKFLTGQFIPQGSSTYTFSVQVKGDNVLEPDEIFYVDISNVIGATVGKGRGIGTILNDDGELPISDLLDFRVSKNGEGGTVISGAAIIWHVLPEHGIGYFEVEKSYDGRSFSTLRHVPVRAGITAYGTTDSQLQAGPQYYRLKLVDIDGSVSYSRIKAFHWDEVQLVSVHPNPVGSTLSVSFSAARPGDLEVRLINMLGQTTLQQTVGLSAGQNTFSMDVGNLSGGMYFLRYSFGGTSGGGEGCQGVEIVIDYRYRPVFF